jgi:mannose-6-phosphate isomerase-like protein (cupin superfamily)
MNCFKDCGPNPIVADINALALTNNTYRTAIWTGPHLQVTLMSIPIMSSIGLEEHSDTDQIIYVAKGYGMVQMGKSKDDLCFNQPIHKGGFVCVPAGTWHNITNIGNRSLQLYTIYAPPHHPHGTIQQTAYEMGQ